MNNETLKALDGFISSVQKMACGVYQICGEDVCTEVVKAGSKLRECLDKDASVKSEKWRD